MQLVRGIANTAVYIMSGNCCCMALQESAAAWRPHSAVACNVKPAVAWPQQSAASNQQLVLHGAQNRLRLNASGKLLSTPVDEEAGKQGPPSCLLEQQQVQ